MRAQTYHLVELSEILKPLKAQFNLVMTVKIRENVKFMKSAISEMTFMATEGHW